MVTGDWTKLIGPRGSDSKEKQLSTSGKMAEKRRGRERETERKRNRETETRTECADADSEE